jgi:hypothetical protein
MVIMGIGGLLFQPLLGILAHGRGLDVPDASTLSVLIVSQLLALAILGVGFGLSGRERKEN